MFRYFTVLYAGYCARTFTRTQRAHLPACVCLPCLPPAMPACSTACCLQTHCLRAAFTGAHMPRCTFCSPLDDVWVVFSPTPIYYSGLPQTCFALVVLTFVPHAALPSPCLLAAAWLSCKPTGTTPLFAACLPSSHHLPASMIDSKAMPLSLMGQGQGGRRQGGSVLVPHQSVVLPYSGQPTSDMTLLWTDILTWFFSVDVPACLSPSRHTCDCHTPHHTPVCLQLYAKHTHTMCIVHAFLQHATPATITKLALLECSDRQVVVGTVPSCVPCLHAHATTCHCCTQQQ